MIVKQAEPAPRTTDPRRKAGHDAERQMAFYLNRAFADDDSLLVLNDLRIIDEATPEHDGSPTTCQIDHLIIHRWGMFIIESKSVSMQVKVRDDGSGGDQWTSLYQGRDRGMPSPIAQARRQADALRTFLQRNREKLLGKIAFGLRTFVKIAAGTDQRGFKNMPIQIIIAISDGGDIKRVNNWREPEGPFGTFVCKADLAPDKVRMEFNKHKSSAPILSKDIGEYGIWSMEPEEAPRVAHFLADQHTPRNRTTTPRSPATAQEPTPAPIATAPAPAPVPSIPPTKHARTVPTPNCKSCRSANLAARWGRYGYYWHCLDCATNTAMPRQCPTCGESESNGQTNKIRKEGPNYFHCCHACETEHLIWHEPTP